MSLILKRQIEIDKCFKHLIDWIIEQSTNGHYSEVFYDKTHKELSFRIENADSVHSFYEDFNKIDLFFSRIQIAEATIISVSGFNDFEWYKVRRKFLCLNEYESFETPCGYIVDSKIFAGDIFVDGFFSEKIDNCFYGYDIYPGWKENYSIKFLMAAMWRYLVDQNPVYNKQITKMLKLNTEDLSEYKEESLFDIGL